MLETDQLNEVHLFQDYLAHRMQNGRGPQTIREALDEFAEYQKELAELRQKLQVAQEQSDRGESEPFEAARTKDAVCARLAKEGIPIP
jgi:hypothetical protein